VRVLSAFVAVSALVACSKSVEPIELASFSDSQAEAALASVSGDLSPGDEVLFICGQSDGLAIYASDWGNGFQKDGITSGRLVFLKRANQEYDLIFRDTFGEFETASNEGARVERIDTPLDKSAESWVIVYPKSGITETHNILSNPDGGLVDLWTTNKPVSILRLGKSARLFYSACRRV